jgi:DNA polymerase-3 subunit gamma/tau
MARLLQQMAVEQVVPGALDATDPDTDSARQLAAVLAPDETQLLYSMALQGRAELSLAPDEYAGLVMVLLRFLAFPAQDGGATRGAPAPKPAAAPAPASAALQARVAERTRAVVPPPAVARPASPPPTAAPAPRPAASAPRPAVAATPNPAPPPRQPAAQTEDEPPPWMDEAPFEGEAAAAPAPTIEPAVRMPPSAVTEVPVVQRTALGDRWAELVASLVAANSITALARELAMQAELTLVEPGEGSERWCLRVDRETLRAPTLSDKLQAALRAHTGLTLRLEVVAGTPADSPARREAEAAARRQREAEAIIHGDPLVQAMLAQFSTARIVPGSIRPA